MLAPIIVHPSSAVQLKPYIDAREQLVEAVTDASVMLAQSDTIAELQATLRLLSREMTDLIAAHHHILTTTEGRDYMQGVAKEAIARTHVKGERF